MSSLLLIIASSVGSAAPNPVSPTPAGASTAAGTVEAPSTGGGPTQKSRVPKPRSAEERVPEGPVDFRCDRMDLSVEPNRTVCVGNVVLRRSDLLVCCRRFEGTRDERGQLQRLLCIDDVRARRGEETMWADRAEYRPDTADLVLTGRPLVRRGQSLLVGDRVTVNVKEEQARIERPRGHVATEDMRPLEVTTAVPAQDLPSTCPVPAAPSRR